MDAPATYHPGIYIVGMRTPLAVAPLDARAIAAWRRRVPTMSVDGVRVTQATLTARLASFWIPSATVLYIGQASGPVTSRVAAYYRTPLGNRSPHAGGHWIMTLAVLQHCRVWSAATDDFDAVEEDLLDDFARTVPPAERRALHDSERVLPFANLEDGRGLKKRHGIKGSKLP
jgi:hypothetical protein